MAEQASIVISATDATAGAFRAVGAKLGDLQGSALAVSERFAALSGALAGAFAAGGIGAFVQQTINGIDSLNDLADATGASIEAISALEDTALRTGTTLDTAGAAMLKLNQVLNQAKPDSDVARILESIGLSAEELRAQDPAEALASVARALANFADDGDKARAVQELFGRSVREVAPLLKDLADRGLQNATVTSEQAKAAEAFNLELAAFSKNATDASRALVSELLPSLTAVLQTVREVTSGGGFAAGVSAAVNTTVQALAVFGANVSFVLQGVGREIGAIGAQIAALARLDLAGFRAISEAVKADAERARRELDAFERRVLGTFRVTEVGFDRSDRSRSRTGAPELPQLRIPTPPRPPQPPRAAEAVPRFELPDNIRDALAAIQNSDIVRVERLRESLRLLTTLEQTPAVTQAIGDLVDQIERLDPASQAAEKARQRLDELTGASRAREQAADIALLDEAFFSGAISADQFEAGLRRVYQGLDGVAEAAKPAADAMSEFGKQAERNIQDAFGDTLLQTIQGNFAGIGRLWTNLLQQLAAQAVAARLTESLFGNAKTGTTGALSGLFDGLFASLGRRALGGPVMAGTPYIVGEQGPELFMPRESGRILPNSRLGGGGGPSVVIHQTINATGGASRADVLLAAEQAKRAAVAEVYDAMRRGRMGAA